MPKKTKKEKILARMRRTPVRQAHDSGEPAHSPAGNAFSYSFTSPTAKQAQRNEQLARDAHAEFKAIKTDLSKTLILSVIAIAFEYALYLYIK